MELETQHQSRIPITMKWVGAFTLCAKQSNSNCSHTSYMIEFNVHCFRLM